MRIGMMLSGVMLIFPVMAAELTLRVQGENLHGKEIRVALYDSALDFPDNDDKAKTAKAVAVGNEVTFRCADLSPGVYAIAAFADGKGNGKLDRNFLSIPTEPYGFSRDARGLTSAPDFADAAFRIADTDITQTFRLQ